MTILWHSRIIGQAQAIDTTYCCIAIHFAGMIQIQFLFNTVLKVLLILWILNNFANNYCICLQVSIMLSISADFFNIIAT